MADIKKALPILWEREHNNDPKKVLHVNQGENGYTFMGIYQKAHPNLELWKIIRQKLQQYNGDKVLAGSILYDNPRVVELVENFYKREFWDKAKLDLVNSQHIANEIFIFGVVAGMPPAIKKAQELVGAEVDGWVGKQTIAALNAFDEKVFDIEFDEEEIEHFKEIAANNPSKAWALKGWINRARAV